MTKRKLSLVMTILAMFLTILNFDFATFNIESKSTWIFISASILLIISIVLLFINKNKTIKIEEKTK
ncbi:hypothetical protein G1L02_03080 [Tenacibaculum finnmarkense]|uniref:Uncharacterized protein n=1 Tax=Tenacibaculum finnmarkense genomovar ulcerans TaxID=2781388 RepID=A0A2I2M6W2_9FLAO|nr:hypothetical protein [Tenacibaculum finnmarkense]ALU75864.1 hypothetical protein AUW17_11660 [Tenacibaculum dicentrarchi]MBE7633326.1 hypothetical protein [Tenacibaculum finnmarkense genomovar ulcerans]MCD8399248.1 hypothetical protein [Tenacibaculum finnmarkense genomovar ulcerans]MCD8409075.1 hypothetical protein [Tenacibaculum finnmarkense genomovar ulcerans]MCD8429241.1 hypothetical protein [Tenacibaculum finnmarkense genomovar ulcerans]